MPSVGNSILPREAVGNHGPWCRQGAGELEGWAALGRALLMQVSASGHCKGLEVTEHTVLVPLLCLPQLTGLNLSKNRTCCRTLPSHAGQGEGGFPLLPAKKGPLIWESWRQVS